MSFEDTLKAAVREVVQETLTEMARDRDKITVATERAAEMLDVSPDYIYDLVDRGVLAPVKWPKAAGAKGGRAKMYFRVEDLRRAAESHLQRKVS